MPADEQLKQLAYKLRELTEGSAEREAYLQRLANDIREGRYSIDAEAIAEKILQTEFRVDGQVSSEDKPSGSN